MMKNRESSHQLLDRVLGYYLLLHKVADDITAAHPYEKQHHHLLV